jgi:tetratricopeptide (TPR) repeat protein
LGKTEAAIENLNSVISDTTMDVGERMLQDAANVKLGHIYFEAGDQFRQAVEAYSRVEVGSPYGDEALLATAWAWGRVNKPEICREVVDRLIVSYPESPYQPEAHLLKGYALMLLKRYREAISSLEKCLALTKGDYVTPEQLAQQKRTLDRATQDFIPAEQEIKKNALRKPTERIEQERPALRAEYDTYWQENDRYFRYLLLSRSHSKFFRRKEQVIEDAEYALAKATSMLKAVKGVELRKEQVEQEQKVDEEIRKLQEQLKELDE